MKIKPEHLQHLKDRILPLDTPQLRLYYKGMKSLDVRYRWDLMRRAKLSAWIRDNLYNYCNNMHIDTALKSIVKPLGDKDDIAQ